MTREEKVSKVRGIFKSIGIIFLPNKLSLSCGDVDIIQEYGLSEDYEGDWVLRGAFEKSNYAPTITDDDVDKVYNAVLTWASNILNGNYENA